MTTHTTTTTAYDSLRADVSANLALATNTTDPDVSANLALATTDPYCAGCDTYGDLFSCGGRR